MTETDVQRLQRLITSLDAVRDEIAKCREGCAKGDRLETSYAYLRNSLSVHLDQACQERLNGATT